MGTVFFGVICFIAGALVGLKYPDQVNNAVEKTKKLYSDLKDKLLKKQAPPEA